MELKDSLQLLLNEIFKDMLSRTNSVVGSPAPVEYLEQKDNKRTLKSHKTRRAALNCSKTMYKSTFKLCGYCILVQQSPRVAAILHLRNKAEGKTWFGA